MDELLDIASVAAYLGVSERTVYNRVRSGDLPAVKVGRLWRVRAADLEAWLGGAESLGAELAAEGEAIPTRDDLERVLGALEDRVERRLAFVAVLTSAYEALGWPDPVVVGGHAVEFWTAGGYATVDIDLAGASEPAAQILGSWGFVRQGRHWFDEALGIVLEVPGSSLGREEMAHTVSLRIGNHSAVILGIEDLIIDRLSACVHWEDEESCLWAKAMLAAGHDIDRAYLEKRARSEDVLERLEQLRSEGRP